VPVPFTFFVGAEGEMRKTRQGFAMLLTIALAAGCSSGEPRAAASSSEPSNSIHPEFPEIAAELIRMAEADQLALRAVFSGDPQALDTAALAQAAARLDSLDRAHTARLKEIIRTMAGRRPRVSVGKARAPRFSSSSTPIATARSRRST